MAGHHQDHVGAAVAVPAHGRPGHARRWWLPDVYILHLGAPPRAVAVLMVMHLAIAVVTYTLLTRVAPVRPPGRKRAVGRHAVIAGQED